MIRLFFILTFFSVSASAELPNFIALAKKVNPAIVNISTTQTPKLSNYGDPMMEFLERFYGVRPQMQPIQSLGSGFIIDPSGLIITNNHVVDQADEIEVQLADNETKYKAKLIGKDPKTDIALIKINAKKDLPAIKLGSSEKLQVGEWVAAFGNPLGFTHSMTKGIVSAKGRDVNEIGIFPFIQTDASINPGNSGGPLVNLKGEVVGVNTFIIRGAQGLGFAVPIDGVKQILPDLKSKGHVTRGYLGISYSPVDLRMAKYLGLKKPNGAIIGDVRPASPADKAGLKPYDVILQFGKVTIDTPNALSNAVAKQKIGSKVKVKVWREGKERIINVKIESPPEDFHNYANQNIQDPIKGILAPYNIGFRYTINNASIAKRFSLPNVRRPVIVDVIKGSPADQAGLASGDIILEINRKNIRKPGDIKKYLNKGKNLIRVQRGEYRVALFIES